MDAQAAGFEPSLGRRVVGGGKGQLFVYPAGQWLLGKRREIVGNRSIAEAGKREANDVVVHRTHPKVCTPPFGIIDLGRN